METLARPSANALFPLVRQNNLSGASNSTSTSMSASSEDDIGCLSPFAAYPGSTTQPSSSELDTPPQSPLDEVNTTTKHNDWRTEMTTPKSFLERFLFKSSNTQQIQAHWPSLSLAMSSSDADGGYESGAEEALATFTKSSRQPRSRRSATLLGNASSYRSGGEKQHQSSLHGPLDPPTLPAKAHTTAARVARRHTILSQQQTLALSRSSSEESSAYSDSSSTSPTTLQRPPKLVASVRPHPIDLSDLRPPVFRSDVRQNVTVPTTITTTGMGVVFLSPASPASNAPLFVVMSTVAASPRTPDAPLSPLRIPNYHPPHSLPFLSSQEIIRASIVPSDDDVSTDESLPPDATPPGAPLLKCAELLEFPASSEAETEREPGLALFPPPSPPPTTPPHYKMLSCVPLPLSPSSEYSETSSSFDLPHVSTSSTASPGGENTPSIPSLFSDIYLSSFSSNTGSFPRKTIPETTTTAPIPIPPRLRNSPFLTKLLSASAPPTASARCLARLRITSLAKAPSTHTSTAARRRTSLKMRSPIYTSSSTSTENALHLVFEEPEPEPDEEQEGPRFENNLNPYPQPDPIFITTIRPHRPSFSSFSTRWSIPLQRAMVAHAGAG